MYLLGTGRKAGIAICSQDHELIFRAKSCTLPTCLPFAHDQAGVVENLFFIIMVYHLALAKVGCYTGRIYHGDQLHTVVFQVIPTRLVVIFFQHGGE